MVLIQVIQHYQDLNARLRLGLLLSIVDGKGPVDHSRSRRIHQHIPITGYYRNKIEWDNTRYALHFLKARTSIFEFGLL